jgi:hypothetical protein
MSIYFTELGNTQTNTRQELVIIIKAQKETIDQLVSIIERANIILLDAAATAATYGEADRILSASKLLVHGVAGAAKT